MDSAQRESTQKRERMAFFLVGLNLGQGMGFVFLDKRVSTELWLTKQFRGMETKRVVLLRRVCTKTIFSPRQARDKHRESTQKKSGVSAGLLVIVMAFTLAFVLVGSAWD